LTRKTTKTTTQNNNPTFALRPDCKLIDHCFSKEDIENHGLVVMVGVMGKGKGREEVRKKKK